MNDALGLYVHLPFCRHRCGYCDFSTSVRPESDQDAYVERLLEEIRWWSGLEPGRRAHSVYFGGGTPSLIGPERIGRILDRLRRGFTLDSKTEITLEANPDSTSPTLLSSLRKMGVNRLSLGVQSWQPSLLERLGRCHSADRALQAFGWAREAGYDNISIDLIYGIPGQFPEQWQNDLERTTDLLPEHLSLYELTLEPWTPMGRQVDSGKLRLPEEEDVLRMDALAEASLLDRGYARYEISNYARPGRQCLHNRQTWRQGEFLGFGLAASSHWRGKRFRNPDSWTAYVAGQPSLGSEAPGVYEVRWLDDMEKWSEGLILGLRLSEGVWLNELADRASRPIPAAMRDVLQRYEKSGLLIRNGNHLQLTGRGRLLSDMLFADLVTGAEPE